MAREPALGKSARKRKGKAAPEENEELVLDYRLIDLPSAQHRAGLAGLVMLVRWLGRAAAPQKGIARLESIDEAGASFRFDHDGLQRLLDEFYDASEEEVRSSSTWKNKAKEVVPPLREETETSVDPRTRRSKTRTVYIYPQVVPRAAFLLDTDPTADKESGLWVKLWRDMLKEVFRGVPATRRPYEERAEGRPVSEAETLWDALRRTDPYPVDLPSTYYLGAQQLTAEQVPFRDSARLRFLLVFWPAVAQIYIPSIVDGDGNRENAGWAIAAPDIRSLDTFCAESGPAMRDRDTASLGFRPRGAVVDLAGEGALATFTRLQARLATRQGASTVADLLVGMDVFHVEKDGNNVRIRATGRISPEPAMIDRYAQLHDGLWDPLFRRQCLLNLVEGRPWFDGFDAVVRTRPQKQTIGSSYFQHDCRVSFDNFDRGGTMNAPTEGPALEPIVYRLAESYVYRKLEAKYGLKWEQVKEEDARRSEYDEKKSKIVTEAFLAVRSRTAPTDFVDYVASAICSVPQRLPQADYLVLARALKERPDEVRTLLLLALSARA
ncbi:MAG: type I-MYXAN CRISPR-associated protein Cmx8 [Thermoanaerobaculia bacterium]|nr:type I-MYXAN CRISPR-associated protein Cmx8 [Thermoanaerobaculia bacterium]